MNGVGMATVCSILLWVVPGKSEPFVRSDNRATVQVTGSAEVSAIPDRARLFMGVTETGRSVSAAKEVVDAQVGAIVAALRRRGIPDTAIDVAGLQVYRRMARPVPGDLPDTITYRVRREVEVTLREIEMLDQVIDSAIGLGVDEIREVRLYTSRADSLRDEAIRLAADDATHKARLLAAQFGRIPGPLFLAAYQFAPAQGPVPFAVTERGGVAGGFATGVVRIRAEVQAVFELQ